MIAKNRIMSVTQIRTDRVHAIRRRLLIFKLGVTALCGFLWLRSWLYAADFHFFDTSFGYKYYAILLAYAAGSIVLRTGWTTPCAVLGATLGSLSIFGQCRCGPMRIIDDFVANFTALFTAGIVIGLLLAVVFDSPLKRNSTSH
jgi:hypothetical protein